MDEFCLSVMHLVGRHQSDADTMAVLIVPAEEAAASQEPVGFWRPVFSRGSGKSPYFNRPAPELPRQDL
jgi:hypothetical protein